MSLAKTLIFDPLSEEALRARASRAGLVPLPLRHPLKTTGPLVYLVGDAAPGRILEIPKSAVLEGVATQGPRGWFYIVRTSFDAIVHDLATGERADGSSRGRSVSLDADRLYRGSPLKLLEAYARSWR